MAALNPIVCRVLCVVVVLVVIVSAAVQFAVINVCCHSGGQVTVTACWRDILPKCQHNTPTHCNPNYSPLSELGIGSSFISIA